MNTTQLEAMKAGFAREILNEQDESLIKKVIAFFVREKQVSQAPPCRYTPEQIKDSANVAIRQRKEGRHISHEEMKRVIEIDGDTVFIFRIWDCRQKPSKLRRITQRK